MKRLSASVLTLSAGPALAHSGAHIHPHGSDTWIAVALATGLGGLVYLIWGRK